MREILFKAKRLDDGEWVEGYFAKGKWYLDDDEMTVIFSKDLDFFPHSEISSYYDVDPETVCQYTGLKDKNGRKIFEGDILCRREYLFSLSGETKFRDLKSEVALEHHWNCGCCDDIFGYFCKGVLGLDNHRESEVIGNIFDNPELLEVTE